MVKAKDIMTRELITVSPDTDITEAAKILLDKHINGLPVVDKNGKLVGIICQSDLISLQKKVRLPSVFTLLDTFIPVRSQKSIDKELEKIAAAKVVQAMTADPVVINAEDTVEDIATLMVEKNLHTLPVVEDGKLVGVVGKEDILSTLMPSRK
ncbi:CBS domain-containing protein [Desulfoferrobacter suflitae]|uniref:CBS domain-containing protein n=1 Tax=Desulfoferrobacter suflitae TaxID=2865782 RepID=UPI00216401DE|nr:CBS domain-containing protein [Desulfoferrobacter suflitae]MCK8601056.1 CBS domain-containing protein [Desulfoferrobacter suflitae]